MSDTEKTQIVSVEGIVARRDKRPYVVLLINNERAQLTVADARRIAADLVQMAARTEADAMIHGFFERMEFPAEAGNALMIEFREFRRALDREPVDNFQSEPTQGENLQ
jgi:hypothetical protein